MQEYSLSVVMDVVKRYDVDGIHFDDYFYPYKAHDGAGRELDFPDDASWSRFGARSKLSRGDWRRENVNRFVQQVYRSIKAAKPSVKFGISPFGVWRPKNPQAFDAYAAIYADSRKWLASGWVDYLAPQLYWSIDSRDQSFPVLLRWWAAQNTRSRILCPGIDSSKVGRTESGTAWQPQEIINQIRLIRARGGGTGHIHWSMSKLMRNSAYDAVLEREVYAQPALMPPLPGLGRTQPGKPKLTMPGNGYGSNLELRWTLGGPGRVWLWLLQSRTGREWKNEIMPASATTRAWSGTPPEVVALSAVNREGQISSPSVVEAHRGSR